MSAQRDRLIRRIAATAMTLWLIGIIPAWLAPWRAVMPGSASGRKLPFGEWWCLLGPVLLIAAVVAASVAGLMLAIFYEWALGPTDADDIAERISELERELDIGQGKP